MTAQIAAAIEDILKPRGVAVIIEAEHTCMSVRGVAKHGAIPSPAASPACSATIRRSSAFPVHGARAAARYPRVHFARPAVSPSSKLHDRERKGS